ncbi:MAG: hypothetical protein M1819_001824 [Sarea resinae]|nr:MAG: hypothetical protein M1819_001824 [Sarea resinae]
MPSFPEVQGGGSLMLAWQVKGKRVLVVGGGEVAAGRILALLNADALITVICPATGLNPEVSHRLAQGLITHIDRRFEAADLADASTYSLVLTAIDDPATSSQIYTLCHAKNIPANIADVPPECDFYFGSIHRDGPVQIMVSTNGNGPRIAALVRRRIAATLPANLGAAVQRVGELRRQLRVIAPGDDEGKKRMRWISGVSDRWTLDQLCGMSDADIGKILAFYESGKVPRYEDIHPEETSSSLLYAPQRLVSSLLTGSGSKLGEGLPSGLVGFGLGISLSWAVWALRSRQR